MPRLLSAAIGLVATMPVIQAVTERQWNAMRAVIEAKAKLQRISLADKSAR